MKKINDIYLWLIYGVITLLPVVLRGIICNDELLLRLWRQQGIKSFFQTTIVREDIQQGRILGAIGNLKFLAYLSENKYAFGVVNVAFILISILLLCYFAKLVTNSRFFSALLAIMILAFLPVTFELSVPNAHVIVALQPMILLEISLINYLKYCRNKCKKSLLASCLFLLWGMFLYEFVITYMVLFLIICLYENIIKQKKKLQDAIKEYIPMAITAILYLVLYFGQSKVFSTSYEGTMWGQFSIKAIWRVVKMFFISAIPGYYCSVNEKYNYLFHLYNNGSLSVYNYLRIEIIIFVLTIAFIFFYLYKNKKRVEHEKKYKIVLLGSGLLYSFLPSLPNALTELYQNTVSSEAFTSVPVSIYIYYAEMFTISYVIWLVVSKVQSRVMWVGLSFVIVAWASRVQIYNYTFTDVHIENYERICSVERLLKLDYWKQFENTNVLSPSIFKTYNTLYIEDSHWTNYASVYGNNLSFEREDLSGNANLNLVIQGNNDFYIYSENWGILATTKREGTEFYMTLLNNSGQYDEVILQDEVYVEDGLVFYSLDIK